MDLAKFLISDLKFEVVTEKINNTRDFDQAFLPSGHYDHYRRDVWNIFVYEKKGTDVGLEVILRTEIDRISVFRGQIKPREIIWVLSHCTNLLRKTGALYHRDKVEIVPDDDFVEACWINKCYVWKLDEIIKAPLTDGVHFIVPDDMELDQAQEIIEPALKTAYPCIDETMIPADAERIPQTYLGTFDRLKINFINVTTRKKFVISTGNVIDTTYQADTFGIVFIYRLGLKALKYDMVDFVTKYLVENDMVHMCLMMNTIHNSVRLSFFSDTLGEFELTGDYDELVEYFTAKYGDFL